MFGKDYSWTMSCTCSNKGDSKNGVYYAGTLLVQHVLIIGSDVGIHPTDFTTFGEITDRAVKRNLNKQLRFFDGDTDPTA
eukprot:5244507-Ditylum_brightwellii.AAC.1